MFSLWCIDWVGSLYANRIFMCFCIKSSVGTQDGVGWLWKCFRPPGGLLCWPFWGGGPGLVLLFVALWFILRGDLFCVLTLCYFVLMFLVLLALRLLRLGKRELLLVLFVRLFDLCLFGFVGFLFLLVSGKGCSLWLWHSLDFSLTSFFYYSDLDIFLLLKFEQKNLQTIT